MAENKNASSGIGCAIALGAVAWFGYLIWQQASSAGWISHDVISIVNGTGWSTGEYRTCSEPNIAGMTDEPQIDCAVDGAYDEPKRFDVRFYGETYNEELKDKASFSWRCKKNEGTDPSFTCDEKKVIRWNQTK
jgi:hypothetical protein